MTTSHRHVWLGLACTVAVAVAACSSSGGGSTSSEPVVTELGAPIAESVILESTDGVVELEVPAGSVREGTELGIEIVDVADLAGFAGATPIGNAYRLLPDGLRFVEPLIVAYRVPVEEANRPDTFPLMITMLESAGTISAELEGFSEISETGDFVHRATIDRFGTLVMLDGGVDLTLEPLQVADLTPDDSYVATLTATAVPATIEPWPNYDIELRWLATGAVSTPSAGATETVLAFGADPPQPSWVLDDEYTCDVIGEGGHSVEVSVEISGLPGDAGTREIINLRGEATCGDVGR